MVGPGMAAVDAHNNGDCWPQFCRVCELEERGKVMSDRKFYRTVLQVEILSEEPYDQADGDLAAIAYDITEGDCNGNVTTVVANKEIDGPTAATLLIESGSDPGFFGLTEDGFDE